MTNSATISEDEVLEALRDVYDPGNTSKHR